MKNKTAQNMKIFDYLGSIKTGPRPRVIIYGVISLFIFFYVLIMLTKNISEVKESGTFIINVTGLAIGFLVARRMIKNGHKWVWSIALGLLIVGLLVLLDFSPSLRLVAGVISALAIATLSVIIFFELLW